MSPSRAAYSRPMKRDATDTIAAIATAPGRGGIGIVRVSGPTLQVDRRSAARRNAAGSAGHVKGIRRRRRATRSTRVLSSIFRRRIRSPARMCSNCRATAALWCSTSCCDVCSSSARAGRARRIHAARVPERQDRPGASRGRCRPVDSGSAQAARAAMRSLQRRVLGAGARAGRCHDGAAAMWVEAAIDFPEEEVDFLADRGARRAHARASARHFAAVSESARQGALLRDGHARS